MFKSLRDIKTHTVKRLVPAQDESDDDIFGIKGLKVSELKEALKERGLSQVGLKAVLYNRLKEYMENEENFSVELEEQDEDCAEDEDTSGSESSESSESENESESD